MINIGLIPDPVNLSLFSVPKHVSPVMIFFHFFRDIWSKFLAFESQVGDLASIVKVEKRRAQTIEKVRDRLAAFFF